MVDSETFRPVGDGADYASGYCLPEVFAQTSSMVLYRVRKAGKYFIIKTPKQCNGQAVAMLQREYEMSVGKSHPNIVNVFTYEPSTIVGPGIVMEYVDGVTLNEFLAGNPSPALRKRVLMQLLSAVAYIHRCGLVHNDIKPENIMITRADNSVRLIDFGLADNDAFFLARTLGCTPAYASPELLARKDGIDTRSDIYSLGVIIKEMFGKRYSRIASRCLYINKEQRYANADELIQAFERERSLKNILWIAALFVLVLLPAAMYVNEHMALNEARARLGEQQQFVDSVRAVEACDKAFADSVKQLLLQRTRAAYRRVCDSIDANPPASKYDFVRLSVCYGDLRNSMDIWLGGKVPMHLCPELQSYDQMLNINYMDSIEMYGGYDTLPDYLP